MLPPNARPFFTRFQHDLKHLQELAQHDVPDALIRSILETGYVDYVRANYEGAESRLEDIEQLGVFARSYRSLQALLSELILLGELYGQDVAAGSSAETERLILSSVHQAKGLEWQVVFLLRMCEGGFPSPMALREEGGEEEERRIFYVATTRAKEDLYILHPLVDLSPRGAGGLLLQPSRFLQEIPFTLYEQGEIDLSASSAPDLSA